MTNPSVFFQMHGMFSMLLYKSQNHIVIRQHVQTKHEKSQYISGKAPTVKSCFKFNENNWLSAFCQILAKHFKPDQNHSHPSVQR